MTFGAFIGTRRKAAKLNLRDTAKYLGIAYGYLCDIEQGRRPAPEGQFVDRISSFLELDKQEHELLLDLAAESRQSVPADLPDYIRTHDIVRAALRVAKEVDATDEECIAAAKLANADGFIRHLPDGYNTMLTGDGANLSQGQRQLLAIARAAVADPPVLILDEATSSIDTRTETLVQRGMDALMKGRTTFVIAHRLSTVKNADCIMVLEQGRIIERGTHDELVEQQGRYYQLYTGKKALA